MEKMKIPRAVFELGESVARSKTLLQRMDKGEKIITQAVQDRSVIKAEGAIRLFNKLAVELNDEMENALLLHEMLATGKTTLIDRQGRAVNAALFNPKEEKVVELFDLKTIQTLRDVFGEDNIIEFETESF